MTSVLNCTQDVRVINCGSCWLFTEYGAVCRLIILDPFLYKGCCYQTGRQSSVETETASGDYNKQRRCWEFTCNAGWRVCQGCVLYVYNGWDFYFNEPLTIFIAFAVIICLQHGGQSKIQCVFLSLIIIRLWGHLIKFGPEYFSKTKFSIPSYC